MSQVDPAADPQVAFKRAAAIRAVDFVQSGMKLGLGTGSTAIYATRRIGELLATGQLRDIVAFATSTATWAEAVRLGIPMLTEDLPFDLDLTIDGADEVDPQLNVIKGGGGALLREKIVASLSRHVVIIVDSHKQVSQLGAFPLPVEVVQFAWKPLAERLAGLGAQTVLRSGSDGRPYVTDEENFILDCAFSRIDDPVALAVRLDAMPGVVDHGLFVGLAHTVIVGCGDETLVINR